MYYPIWRTLKYESTADTLTYRIVYGDDVIIYTGKAVRMPDEDKLIIYLNGTCKNYLNSLIYKQLTSITSSDEVVIPNSSSHEFHLDSFSGDSWSTVYTWGFINDWSYETTGYTDSVTLSEPINGHACPSMIIPYTYFLSGDTGQICYSIVPDVEWQFSMVPAQETIRPNADYRNVTVTSNLPWTAEFRNTEHSHMSAIVPSAGTAGNTYVSLYFGNNYVTGSSGAVYIDFYSTDKTGEVQKTYTWYHQTLFLDTYFDNGQTSIEVPASATTAHLTIESSGPWEIGGASSGLSFSRTSGNSADSSVTVSFSANTGTSSNTMSFTVNSPSNSSSVTSENMTIVQEGVPELYTNISGIFADSGQSYFIDTLYTPTLNTTIKTNCNIREYEETIIGRTGSYCLTPTWDGVYFDIANSVGPNRLTAGLTSLSPQYIGKFEGQVYFGLDNHNIYNYTSNKTVTGTTVTTPISGTCLVNLSNIILNSIQFYENDVLTADYTPVKRESDGIFGLYDSINNVFVTGSGFTVYGIWGDNVITYVGTDGWYITPNFVTGFGANYIDFSRDGIIYKMIFDNDVTTIPDGAFSGITALTSIYIPNHVTSIGNNSFKGDSNLKSVSFGSGIKSIGDNAFRSTKLQDTLTLNDGVETLGLNSFSGCSYLLTVNLPDSIKEIKAGSFRDCLNLRNINIPTGITAITEYMFQECPRLREIYIPTGIQRIENYAFSGCSSLSSITAVSQTAPAVSNNAFLNIMTGGTLYYPDGSDYSSWLSTNQYYLGYYNWNREYVDVSYIYADSGHSYYLDTLYTIKLNTTIKAQGAVRDYTNGTWIGKTGSYRFFATNSAYTYFDIGSNSIGFRLQADTTDLGLTVGKSFDVELRNHSIYNNTISYGKTGTTVSSTISGTCNVNLSCLYLSGISFYENDVLVADFVPVKRSSDNVYGLYDSINDVFVTGSGFTVYGIT